MSSKINNKYFLKVMGKARLAKPVMVNGNWEYEITDPTSIDLEQIAEEAPALYIPSAKNKGIILDYTDWKDVEIWDVQKYNSRRLTIIKETSFSYFNGVALLRRSFPIEDILISATLEISRQELMFIGVIVHAKIAFKDVTDEDVLIERACLIDDIYDMCIFDCWAGDHKEGRYRNINCDIESEDRSDTHNMNRVIMNVWTEEALNDEFYWKSRGIPKALMRLTQGPGLLDGYYIKYGKADRIELLKGEEQAQQSNSEVLNSPGSIKHGPAIYGRTKRARGGKGRFISPSPSLNETKGTHKHEIYQITGIPRKLCGVLVYRKETRNDILLVVYSQS